MSTVMSAPVRRSLLATSLAAGAAGLVGLADVAKALNDSEPPPAALSDAEKGCQVAAWERPEIFAVELRATFRSLR